ncbi:type II toxin-antitoxin system VapB family antitoxin [Streptomyces sp. TRM64462]|uniref:type II toxin-antitoxin system VapB family antitoxin n=1 Tax=Streptomyces sp. TRM64462 TaxID=2741726 RepID=UPI001586B5C0|nr:type II toxin-antitoxin system VapB family antitoxin [Streptomyces sp. TRM64462]
MAKVNVGLDAELVVEVMVLAGVGNPQDAVELVLRDYIARGHRTESRATSPADDSHRTREIKPPDHEA